VVRKPAFDWKETSENPVRLVAAIAAAMSLVLTGCAPLSPHAKYLFAPEVRTCPAETEKSTSSSHCWARVKEPVPKLIFESSCGSGETCDSNQTFEKCDESGQHLKCDGTEQLEPCVGEMHKKCGITTVTVAQGTDYATQVEEEYIGAKAEYGSIPAAAGLLLVPAGVSAMSLGALGVSATAVTALGFGSAAILGGAYLLSNQPREKAYMQGADALECLKGTMQPFDVDQSSLTLGQLCSLDSTLEKRKAVLQRRIAEFGGKLSASQIKAGSTPDAAAKKKLCYGEKLLKAANSSLQSATIAYDSSTKYYNYSYDNSGYEMVNTVNSINNKVSAAMITTEPDLHALANSLGSIIPESAQKLAGIDKSAAASKTAVEKAASDIKSAQAVAPNPGAVALGISPGFDDCAEVLLLQINATNNSAEEVVNRTPSDILPKTKDCMKVFNQPGAPPDVLTLNPAGDITLRPGENQKVVISGGKLPYEVRWLCDCYNVGVTAQTTYQDTTATIVIAASDTAADHGGNTYPLMITDSTGIGSPLNVVVNSKKADNSDTPDCAETTARSSTGGAAGPATVNAVAQAAAGARTAALRAAKAAAAAKADADKAEAAASDGKKADAASAAQRATKDAARAYTALATTQTKAGEARAMAGGSNDPVVTNLVQTADDQIGSAAKSAADAGADAARAQRARSDL
jgi:hypothetical protein